jgi:hypothetical protein
MYVLGRIPLPSDHFELGDLRIEVVDMDRNRVDKVLIARPLRVASANVDSGEQSRRRIALSSPAQPASTDT